MKIVILPGLDGTGLLLENFAKALAATHTTQVVSYPVDLVGYTELGAWLEQSLPREDYVLVAESFSGPLALALATRPSQYLKAVVFVATFARAPRALPLPLLRPLQYLPSASRFLSCTSEPFVMGRAGDALFRQHYRKALKCVPVQTLVKRLQQVLQLDVRALLSQVNLPCAYLRASEDLLVPASVSDDFRFCCKDFWTVKGPHFVLQAAPADCANLVARFVDQRPTR